MTATKQRLHQSTFREMVISAYNNKCSLCELKHRELLDAAHIIPDAEEYGDERRSPLAEADPDPSSDHVEHAIVAFIQCEPRDEERGDAVLKQAVKYFRWFSRKREVSRLVLHSFAHLAEERSSPEFARDLLQELGGRLGGHGFEVHHTPFGWSLQWTMSVEGHGYAKTFKSL